MDWKKSFSASIIFGITLLALSVTGISCGYLTHEFNQLDLHSNAPDQITPTNLSWIETSPSPLNVVNAIWSLSKSSNISNQKIQFFSDALCISASAEYSLNSNSVSTKSFTGTYGATVSYKIITKEISGKESISGCSAPMVLGQPPTSPILEYDQTNILNQVAFSWAHSTSGVNNSYAVLRGTSPGGPYPQIVCSTVGTTCTDAAVTPGIPYYYILQTTNASGNVTSAEKTIIPIGPFSILTTVPGHESASLTWGISTGATSYSIFYGLSSGNHNVAWAPSSISPASLNKLNNGSTYFFRVKAKNSTGSGWSTLESSTTPAGPGRFKIYSVSSTSSAATLAWSNSTGSTGYSVRYGTTSGSYPNVASTSATSPLTITGLSSGTNYYFMVTATDGTTNLDAENEINAFTGVNWTILGAQDSIAATSSAAPGGMMAIDKTSSPNKIIICGRVSTKAACNQFSSGSWSMVGGALASAGVATGISVAVAPPGAPNAGNIYLAYGDATVSQRLSVKFFDGTTWNTLGSLGISSGAIGSTSTVADSLGNIWVLFTLSGKPNIMFWDGSSWSPEVEISSNTTTSIHLALDSSTVPNIPWAAYNDVTLGKAVVQKRDSGTWSQVGNISGNSSSGASIAIDSTGIPYVTYQNNTNYRLSVVRYVSGAWALVGSSNFTERAASQSKIVFDSSDTPYVAYLDTFRTLKASVQKFSAGSWSPVGTLGFSELPYGNLALRFAIDSADNLYVSVPLNNSNYTVYAYANGVDRGASALSWSNTYPSSSSSLTATWAPSTSVNISNQKIQFFSDEVCFTPTGGIVDLASTTASSANFSASVGYHYSYRVLTEYSVGNPIWSNCSTPMSRQGNFVHISNFIEPVGQSGFNGSYPARLALDRNNRPYAPYYETKVSGGMTIRTSLSGMWSDLGPEGSNLGFWGDIGLDSDGKIYSAGNNGTNSKTTVKSFNFATNSWSVEGISSFTPNQAAGQKMAIDLNKNLPTVAFIDSTIGANLLGGMKFDGANWNFLGTQITPEPTLAMRNAYGIAVDANGATYMVHIEAATLNVAVYKFENSLWTQLGLGPVGISSSSGWTSIALNPTTQKPIVAFSDAAASNQTSVLQFDGTSWIQVGAPGFVNTAIVLTVDTSGTPWAIGTNGFIYKVNSGVWSTQNSQSVSVVGGTSTIANVSIAVDSYGVPWISFQDSTKFGSVWVKKWSP